MMYSYEDPTNPQFPMYPDFPMYPEFTAYPQFSQFQQFPQFPLYNHEQLMLGPCDPCNACNLPALCNTFEAAQCCEPYCNECCYDPCDPCCVEEEVMKFNTSYICPLGFLRLLILVC